MKEDEEVGLNLDLSVWKKTELLRRKKSKF
jgi:hypothetical protein